MANRRTAQLTEAMKTRCLMRFNSQFEECNVCGYVMDIGPQFFILAVVSDHIRFDGFECFRVCDVRNLRPEPYASFVETALRKRNENFPRKPNLSLENISQLLLTASQNFPLVTIHRERIDPEICQIGRVVGVKRGSVSLLEILPGAVWEETPENYRLRDITRISFGADYENALYLVGNDPQG